MTPFELLIDVTGDLEYDVTYARAWVSLCLPEGEREQSVHLPVEAIAALYPAEVENGPNYDVALQLGYDLRRAEGESRLNTLHASKSDDVLDWTVDYEGSLSPLIIAGYSVTERIAEAANLNRAWSGYREYMKWLVMYTWLQPFLEGEEEKVWASQAKKMCRLANLPYREDAGKVIVNV